MSRVWKLGIKTGLITGFMKTWFKPGQVKTKAAKNPVVNRVRAGAVVVSEILPMMNHGNQSLKQNLDVG